LLYSLRVKKFVEVSIKELNERTLFITRAAAAQAAAVLLPNYALDG
jgi:hypothetical protein